MTLYGKHPRFASAGLPLLCNRDMIGSDGWIHIVPKGELKNAEAGVTQVLDDTALDAILGNLKNVAQRGGLYMGEEHFIYDDARSSEAFAWGKEFDKRPDGIWAKPEFTDIGEPALKNKRFKFTSFVCDPNQPGAIEKLDQGRVRILKIDTVGFTNFPNGRHLLTPISNRQTLSPEEPDPTAGQADKTKKTYMKLIAQKLGLSAEASEDAILGEVGKLINRATEAEGNIKPITAERDLLKNRVTELLDEQIDADLDAHGVSDETKRAKLKPVLAPMKNRAERVDFLALMGDGKKEAPEAKRLTNREGAKTPSGGKVINADADKAADAKKTALITNRAARIQKDIPGISTATSYITAQREIEAEITSGVLSLK